MVYVESLASQPPDAIDPGANSIDAKVYDIVSSSLNYNAVGSTDQHRGNLSAATVKSNGFGDGDCAEPTWIQGVNFASGSSLGNSSGPGLAGSSSAARIGIIPNAR